VNNGLDKIKGWFRRAVDSAEDVVEGEDPVATPPPGAAVDSDRETSTNAQMEGAAGEPWNSNR
jgi:hypothetical protein